MCDDPDEKALPTLPTRAAEASEQTHSGPLNNATPATETRHPARFALQAAEYQRNGARDLTMICEPQRGWRYALVTERRTKIESAHTACGASLKPTPTPSWECLPEKPSRPKKR